MTTTKGAAVELREAEAVLSDIRMRKLLNFDISMFMLRLRRDPAAWAKVKARAAEISSK